MKRFLWFLSGRGQLGAKDWLVILAGLAVVVGVQMAKISLDRLDADPSAAAGAGTEPLSKPRKDPAPAIASVPDRERPHTKRREG